MVTMRMRAGANAWGKVEEVMVDTHISRKRKGNVRVLPGIYEST